MISLLWRPPTLLVIATLLAKVYSYVPALPSNQTDSSSTGIEGRLDVYVYNVTTPTSITLRSAVVQPNYSGLGLGALVHFSHQEEWMQTRQVFRQDYLHCRYELKDIVYTSTAVALPLTVVLVSCDSNSTNPPHEDISFRARDLKAAAGVLYSLYSETCALTPGYNGTDANMPVYLSPSLNTSRTIEALFSKVDNRYAIWDSQTLRSAFYNISTDTPEEPNVDPDYLVAQAFWNASDAPVFPSPTTSNKNGTAAGAVKAYHVLFSVLSAFTVVALTIA